jgi:hypothetical protein
MSCSGRDDFLRACQPYGVFTTKAIANSVCSERNRVVLITILLLDILQDVLNDRHRIFRRVTGKPHVCLGMSGRNDPTISYSRSQTNHEAFDALHGFEFDLIQKTQVFFGFCSNACGIGCRITCDWVSFPSRSSWIAYCHDKPWYLLSASMVNALS